MSTSRARCVAVDVVGGKGVRVWLGGDPVRDGAKVRLRPGPYPVLMRVEVGAVPPFITRMTAGVRLRDTADPNAAYGDWLAAVEDARPRLEEVVRELPGSAEARSAALLLGRLDTP